MLHTASGKHIAVFRAVALVLSGHQATEGTVQVEEAHDQLVAGRIVRTSPRCKSSAERKLVRQPPAV